jgi:large subunit ribosomal protein L24
MKIKKGDTVLIISGKDRGKTGKILKSFPQEGKILVENINLRKKHRKPRKVGEKGEIVTVSFPIWISSVKLICPKCNQGTRVGIKRDNGKRLRVCKKCQSEF